MHYEPTFESVSTHPVPEWYHDAKLGIFIHWGLYSVPGWAPLAGELGEILESGDWAAWFANNPYAEWYMNSWRIEGSATRQYHDATFGKEFSYYDFAPQFNQAVEGWDPAAWADLFAEVGARYVVLTTKHHDGFLMWPSRTPNPFIPNYHAQRDLCGELRSVVRDRGMEMAYYYSGGLDWTFNDKVIQDIADIPAAVPQQQAYVAYANAHWRELMERYETMMLWNDIAYPAGTDLNVLFAEYYNTLPDGVINNRFTQKFQMQDGNIVSDNHADIDTPEYSSFAEIRAKKWESCRGIGASFGYNRQEGPAQYQSVANLVRSLVDIVSKNGNLLLNVGPTAEGVIPALQVERLRGLGDWLQVNGEAIFNTRPWATAESSTDGDTAVRFTQAPGVLYATLLETPGSNQFEIAGLEAADETEMVLLGSDAQVSWRQTDNGVAVTVQGAFPDAPAHALRIWPQPRWSPA